MTFAAAATFIDAVTPDPVYVDYGMTVIYEGETVYVDNKPMPAAQYDKPITTMAATVEQPPPPTPPAVDAASSKEPAPAEWMSLGVFALAQEKQGEPVAIFQLSVNKAGLVSGAYQSALTDDKQPVAGQVDKTTQNVAWRVGENRNTIYTTTLANLTTDACTVAIHFGEERVQTWLLVRLPQPPPADQPPKAPEMNRTPPPVTPVVLPKQ